MRISPDFWAIPVVRMTILLPFGGVGTAAAREGLTPSAHLQGMGNGHNDVCPASADPGTNDFPDRKFPPGTTSAPIPGPGITANL